MPSICSIHLFNHSAMAIHLPLTKRITFRILLTTVIGLSFTLAAIGYTLLLSWQLEGGAAAINEAGSLRMRSYRLALMLEHNNTQEITQQLLEFNNALENLKKGDAKRPLFLPATPIINKQMKIVATAWHEKMQPNLINLSNNNKTNYINYLPEFVADINHLVSLVEVELSGKTTWLRLCQTILIFLALAASVALLYLLYLWIIAPVNRMQIGIARMSQADLSVRLPIESDNEFGVLTQAFNKMADNLQNSHLTLENRVSEKTAQLVRQNIQIATLYEITSFLAGSHVIEELCRGFLHRIMQHLQVDGGTVRILDNQKDSIHITVHEGIPAPLIAEEQCIKTNSCLCGTAVNQGVILIENFQDMHRDSAYRCQKYGFISIAVFQIQARQKAIGSFSLHFKKERALSLDEQRLLETLGQNLGTAIENQRLIANEKEFAVSQERNLLAQGLHDSIAQGLNFLNLQVQMLEDSVKRNNPTEIADTIPLLRAGVEESYQDVRELLLNFRTRLQDHDLNLEIRNVLAKFQRQTGIHSSLDIQGDGPPLAPEQQLQILFIVQEALSNIRKHAQASEAQVVIKNERDFAISITDDGTGIALDELANKSESHIGLRIMQERASSLGAQFKISNATDTGQGTRIYVSLSYENRIVA